MYEPAWPRRRSVEELEAENARLRKIPGVELIEHLRLLADNQCREIERLRAELESEVQRMTSVIEEYAATIADLTAAIENHIKHMPQHVLLELRRALARAKGGRE